MADTTPEAPSIDDELVELEQEIAKLKLSESLKSDLQPIKQKKDQTQKNYTPQKRDELLKRWKAQATALEQVWKDISNRYANWADLVQRLVCPVKAKIKQQSDVVKSLAAPVGARQGKMADAKNSVDAKKSELDAWLSIDQKLSSRLDDIDKGIKEVKDAYNGADPVVSVYLFWFKVFPLHQSVTPNAADTHEPAIQVAKWPSCLTWPPRGTPYFIAAEELSPRIDAAWQAYRQARDEHAAAESDFNADPDDLSTETRKLDQLKNKEEQDSKDALKRDQNPGPAKAVA